MVETFAVPVTSGVPARLARAALVATLSTAFFAHVFRFGDGSWQTSSLGAWIDPYFINFVLEHWRSSLLHLTDPASPPMYFPATHTLGYSCGLILYVPWYVLLRVWWHPFVAYTLTIFAVLQFGTWSLYAFLRRALGLGVASALVLTFSAATSLNLIHPETGAWTQRASVFLVPQILWLAAVVVTSPSRNRRIAASLAAGTMYGLMFVQDFPSATFTTLTGLLVLAGFARSWGGAASLLGAALAPPPGRVAYVVAATLTLWAVLSRMGWFRHLILGGIRIATDESAAVVAMALLVAASPALRRSAFGRRVSARLTRLGTDLSGGDAVNATALLSMTAGAIAGVLLFLWIYVPAYLEHPMFPREQLLNSLKPVDPAAWQTLTDARRALMPYPSARPFQLVAIATLLAWFPPLQVRRGVRVALTWLAVTSALVLLLPLQFPRFSLWLAVVAPLPGMAAVRDPLRLIPFYELALTVGVAATLARAAAHIWFRRLVVLTAALLMGSAWNRTQFDYERPRADYARWVEPPIRVDPACRSFFLRPGPAAYEARSGHIWSLYGVDAMFVSLAYRIPTLNGYSAWAPGGWELADPTSPEYERKIKDWIARRQIHGVCALDLRTRSMRPWP